MNKTIKQAERYEAPEIREHVISMQTSVLQTSGSINQMNEEDNIEW